ncbi:hypothetical protein [Paenibacillus sp. W2I17]|uniref:hypothetical protein n=1 Tax=Paenibacillus sp. W2I17 TaxID=3042311 RepID=UPI00278368E8|nr:hypothetical protein [Paenibacillus sp. W2I17]MDQ0659503.1 hypothetical protein [Paenibacillus sp. W2I17]
MKLTQTKRMDRYKYLFIVLIIFGVLIGMRSVWSELFNTVDEHRAVNGVLDLRGVDLDQSPVMYLNGEWEIYPDELLTQQDIAKRGVAARRLSRSLGTGGVHRVRNKRILSDTERIDCAF